VCPGPGSQRPQGFTLRSRLGRDPVKPCGVMQTHHGITLNQAYRVGPSTASEKSGLDDLRERKVRRRRRPAQELRRPHPAPALDLLDGFDDEGQVDADGAAAVAPEPAQAEPVASPGSRPRGGAGARRSRRRGDRRGHRTRRPPRRGRRRRPAAGWPPGKAGTGPRGECRAGPHLPWDRFAARERPKGRGARWVPRDSAGTNRHSGGSTANEPKNERRGRRLPKFLLARAGTRRDILSARGTSGPNRLARPLLQCR
jgi:hypothetical protein